MLSIKEVECKSILTKSKIASYAINCYTGCLHACVYCYARYMRRFTGHTEPWGKFVDVKINAADALKKEVQRTKPGAVFMSSACDGWQQLERKYRLSRRCLSILLENRFHVSFLTKSIIVRDDLDILEGTNAELGFTLTTMDNALCRKIEPGASLTRDRIEILKEAGNRGIRTWVFLGPFMPFLSDTDDNVDALFESLAELKLERIYADRLNPRSGVWQSIKSFLSENHPQLIGRYGKIIYNDQEREAYGNGLKELVILKAKKYGLADKVLVVF